MKDRTPGAHALVRATVAALALLAGAGAAAHETMAAGGMIAAAAPPTSGSPEVSITNFQFQPAVLTVPAGTRVTWTNRDSSPHTVTSRDARFSSSAGMDTSDRFSVVFDAPGTYEYFCSLHPMMVGKVIVKPGG